MQCIMDLSHFFRAGLVILISQHLCAALFASDFNGDGNADLAVGAPEDTTTAVNGGSVTTLYGYQTHGLLQAEAQLWYPGFNGLKGSVIDAYT